MLSDEQKIKQKEKKKKILIIAVISVVALFVIAGLVLLILAGIDNAKRNKEREELDALTKENLIFVEPDYNLDIFEDDYYMQLDRYYWITDGFTRTIITDENSASYSPELNFVRQMIANAIAGNYIDYNAMFTQEYLNSAGDDLREMFTMQQIHNIELEVLESNTIRAEAGEFETTSVIKVSYMIRDNNGTFRNDLEEGAIRPIVYMLKSQTDANNYTQIKATGMMLHIKYQSGLYD